MSKPRVLLADDHKIVAEGLRGLLEPEFDLVAIVDDGRELVAAVAEFDPDIIVADISMPLLNGIEAARQILKQAPGSRIIFLTMHSDVAYAGEAFRAGVRPSHLALVDLDDRIEHGHGILFQPVNSCCVGACSQVVA